MVELVEPNGYLFAILHNYLEDELFSGFAGHRDGERGMGWLEIADYHMLELREKIFGVDSFLLCLWVLLEGLFDKRGYYRVLIACHRGEIVHLSRQPVASDQCDPVAFFK